MNDLDLLKESLELAITKKNKPRSSSIAFSQSGKTYRAGKISSLNHILDFPSEMVALAMSTAECDYAVDKIVTITEETSRDISPQVIKFLIDHVRRTGQKLTYSVRSHKGQTLYHSSDIERTFSFYQPERVTLRKILETKEPRANLATIDTTTDIAQVCKTFSTHGLERSFTTEDNATNYGACIVTESGNVYFSGQYSSFDHRSNIHAEMSAIMTTIMRDKSPPTHLGLVSTKHTAIPCEACGICRQFLHEISDMLKFDLRILTFAKDTPDYHEYTLKEYLPAQWSHDPSKIPPR